MNNTVARIVELLFEDVEDTLETRTMKEEVMNNCQEHFDDLVGSGMSEDAAVAAVVESLKGMEEVIADYPRRKAAEGPKETASDDAVTKVLVELGACDVEVRLSEDGRTHFSWNGENQSPAVASFEGNVMRVHQLSSQGEKEQAEPFRFKTENLRWNSFSELLSSLVELGKQAGSAFSSVVGSMGGEGLAVLELPATVSEVNILTASGDVSVEGIAPETLECSTTSGSIRVYPGEGHCAEKVRLRTVSGEIQTRVRTQKLEIGTTSGDAEVYAQAGDIQLHSISGDMDLDGAASFVTFRTTSGDVKVNGAFERVEGKTVSGDMTVRDEGSIVSADMNSTSGDVRFAIPSSRPVSLSCQTVSGDVQNNASQCGEGECAMLHVKTVSGDIQVN